MKKRQNAQIRKPKIIKSFYQTILDEGIEGASIAKVAKRININATLVLHYFGNKENMILELVDFVTDEYTKLFQKSRLQTIGPEERLPVLLNTIWSKAYYEKIKIAASLSVIGISFRNKRIQNKIKGLYKIYKEFLISELTELHNNGIVGKQDFERTSNVLLTMIEGSRYFKHFFVKTKDVDQYNHDMSMAAMGVLKNPSWQN